jgi:hypothetical protein
MAMDFSSRADLEFACFEYKVLSIYGMLDKMSAERRQEALHHMMGGGGENGGDDGGGGQQGWSPIANPREAFHSQQHAPTTSVSGISAPGGAGPIETDHYGRIHFSQQPSSGGGTYEYPEYNDTMIQNHQSNPKRRRM